MTIPEGTDQTVDNKSLTLTKQRGVPIPWTGEDIKYTNGGSGFETIYGDQIKQAMRALTNEIEIDLATEAYANASRAFGTAGTTPLVLISVILQKFVRLSLITGYLLTMADYHLCLIRSRGLTCGSWHSYKG